jgi:hypothetical protein
MQQVCGLTIFVFAYSMCIYRESTPKTQAYLALESEAPAAFTFVNYNMYVFFVNLGFYFVGYCILSNNTVRCLYFVQNILLLADIAVSVFGIKGYFSPDYQEVKNLPHIDPIRPMVGWMFWLRFIPFVFICIAIFCILCLCALRWELTRQTL